MKKDNRQDQKRRRMFMIVAIILIAALSISFLLPIVAILSGK